MISINICRISADRTKLEFNVETLSNYRFVNLYVWSYTDNDIWTISEDTIDLGSNFDNINNKEIKQLNLEDINLDSNTSLRHWYRFEDQDESFAVDEVNAYTMNIFGNPVYEYDSPINLKFLVTEYLKTVDVELDVLSYIKYEGIDDGVYADRMLVFAEHIYGNLEQDFVLKNTEKGPIVVSNYQEAKNFINAGNILNKIQEIDYAFNYRNFIDNVYFKPLWNEIMPGFPLFLNAKNENIKNIIAKEIQEFYRSKGTFHTFSQLFKLIYNVDLVIGDDIYSDNNYQYTIETKMYLSQDLRDFIEKICHPVGYKMNLIDEDVDEIVIGTTSSGETIVTSTGRECLV
jgi:hypothetical protein